jgi:hypothetical protein
VLQYFNCKLLHLPFQKKLALTSISVCISIAASSISNLGLDKGSNYIFLFPVSFVPSVSFAGFMIASISISSSSSMSLSASPVLAGCLVSLDRASRVRDRKYEMLLPIRALSRSLTSGSLSFSSLILS